MLLRVCSICCFWSVACECCVGMVRGVLCVVAHVALRASLATQTCLSHCVAVLWCVDQEQSDDGV